MAAQGNILATTIGDPDVNLPALYTSSTTVAANKTYAPDGQEASGVYRWVDRSGGIERLFPTYSMSYTRPKGPIRNNGSSPVRDSKLRWRVVLPIANITSPSTGSGIQPQPSAAFNGVVHIEASFPETMLVSDRVILWSLLMSSLVGNIFASDETPASSTATPFTDAFINGAQVF
jgi:hypothetical protein